MDKITQSSVTSIYLADICLSNSVCLCFTSHRQRGHLEKAPPFTVPCEGREAR